MVGLRSVAAALIYSVREIGGGFRARKEFEAVGATIVDSWRNSQARA